MVILIILILPVQRHGMPFQLFVSSSLSFMSVQKLFHSTGLLPPEVGLFLGILFFLEVMVNGIVSLISLSGTLLLAFCLSRSPLTHGKFTYPVHADNRHTDCSYLPLLLCCLYSSLSSFHLVECRTDHCVPRNGMPICPSAGTCPVCTKTVGLPMLLPHECCNHLSIHPFFCPLIYACI